MYNRRSPQLGINTNSWRPPAGCDGKSRDNKMEDTPEELECEEKTLKAPKRGPPMHNSF